MPVPTDRQRRKQLCEELLAMLSHYELMRGLALISEIRLVRYLDLLGDQRSQGRTGDEALAETIIGLYKTEVIRKRGPWKTLDDAEYATLEWVDWFNNRRLLAPIGNVPPAEYEQMYYDDINNRSCKAA